MPYTFETTGRNRKTLMACGLVWIALIGAAVLLEASLWLIGLIGLCTVPALNDLIVARRAGVALSADGLSWFAGQRSGDITWNKISHMRLDTRLDFSVRVSAVLTSGRKVGLPLECTPPADTFQEVLDTRGIKVERHHFSLLG